MPGTSATGSTKIALVDEKIVVNLCDGKFYIDASPTIYIGNGDETILGANVQITNPYGVIVKPYGANYEIAPGLSDGMDAVISFNVPTQAGNYQYGQYKVELQMFDDSGNWVVTKYVSVCEPDKKNKTRNYGSLSAQMNASCMAGKLYVIVDGVPTYNGKIAESQVLTGTLEYPTSSGLSPISVTTGNFAATLFEGVYKFTGEICATYNFGDNVYVKVKYKIKKEKNARCIIDRCCVLTALKALNAKRAQDCTQDEINDTFVKTSTAVSLLTQIELAANCGEDPSSLVDELESLLGCQCTCNCAEGTPIINNSPSSDVVIEGCGIESEVNGLTTTYTINNYSYVSVVTDNGGALVVTAGVLDGCVVTQTFTFNISVVYSQIKTLADTNNTEADFWASIIRKSLRSDFTCIGLTQQQIDALSFDGLFKAFVDFMCNCCGTGDGLCESTITNMVVSQTGNDVKLTWNGDAYLYEIYLDGVLMSSILTSMWMAGDYYYTFVGAADGNTHTWLVVSKCSKGQIGETETGTFQNLSCPEVAPVIFDGLTPDDSGNYEVSEICPYDLTALSTAPSPNTVEWHTANNTSAGTILANPASVLGGIYYAFNKDENGCYSPSVSVTVVCLAGRSCSAPQNLQVVEFGEFSYFIKFQSAAFPPPGNSYTVKRRLASDPDEGGSYTTIGNPVWNAGLNRWVIADLTATDNTLYVYRAISNCGESEPSIDYNYVYVVCPSLTIYPTDTTADYSFVPIDAEEISVQLYDSTGTALIDTDTFTPAYSNPTSGTFEYLSPSTVYKVRLKITFTNGGDITIIHYCPFQIVTTDAEIAP